MHAMTLSGGCLVLSGAVWGPPRGLHYTTELSGGKLCCLATSHGYESGRFPRVHDLVGGVMRSGSGISMA